MCASNRHSDALPYVAFLDSWITDNPEFPGQVRVLALAAARRLCMIACDAGDAGLVPVLQCCC